MTQTNDAFYAKFFASDFWSSLDRSRFVTDEHSMLGDNHAFEWIIKSPFENGIAGFSAS